MLEGIDAIDWSALQHACGAASDVPGLVRGLLLPDEDERQEAIMRLFETIWHQGSIYEASSYAVPFLQELLRSDATPDKLPIAQLLADLADGVSYVDAAMQGDAMEALIRDALEREGRDVEKERVESRRHVEATRLAVGKELPLLYPYLRCEVPEIRGGVAAALRHYPERRFETLPLLRQAAASEDDAEAKLAMEEALTVLAAPGATGA